MTFKTYYDFIDKNNIIKILFFLTLAALMFFSQDLYAAAAPDTVDLSDVTTDVAIAARTELLNHITYGLKIFSYLLGVILFLRGGYLMKEIADQKVKIGFGSVAVVFLAATLIFSYTSSLSTIIPTLLGNDSGYCYANIDGDYNVGRGFVRTGTTTATKTERKIIQDEEQTGTCFNPEKSEVTSVMHSKIENMAGASTAQAFVKNLRNIISLFQIIGSIYFIKGVYGLYENANGSAREPGYGKPIVTMIASSFLVDLGHTLEMLLATLRAIGMNF